MAREKRKQYEGYPPHAADRTFPRRCRCPASQRCERSRTGHRDQRTDSRNFRGEFQESPHGPLGGTRKRCALTATAADTNACGSHCYTSTIYRQRRRRRAPTCEMRVRVRIRLRTAKKSKVAATCVYARVHVTLRLRIKI